MDRIVLVELIEGEAEKLSPMGKSQWEEMEALVALPPEDEDAQSELAEITTRMVHLPLDDQHALDRLMALSEGLYASDKAEERGESGEGHRAQAVRFAAGLKDRHEGGQADPGMTEEQAVARLRES